MGRTAGQRTSPSPIYVMFVVFLHQCNPWTLQYALLGEVCPTPATQAHRFSRSHRSRPSAVKRLTQTPSPTCTIAQSVSLSARDAVLLLVRRPSVSLIWPYRQLFRLPVESSALLQSQARLDRLTHLRTSFSARLTTPRPRPLT